MKSRPHTCFECCGRGWTQRDVWVAGPELGGWYQPRRSTCARCDGWGFEVQR